MKKYLLAIAMFSFLGIPDFAASQEFEVLPHKPETRGYIWISEGFAFIDSEAEFGANRFRLGIDLRLGPKSRFDIGWTIIDSFASGETTGSVGEISRFGTGPNIGYYLIPDKLWLMYYFSIQSVEGDRVTGDVTSYGHQAALGYNFFSNETLTLAAELSYLYQPDVDVPVFDVNINAVADAVYPSANIFTLALVLAYDIRWW